MSALRRSLVLGLGLLCAPGLALAAEPAPSEAPAETPGVAPGASPASGPGAPDDDPSRMVYPLAHPPSVTSTFGTYRISHHHAGLDLVTGGDETVAVLAAKAGVVYRLKRGHGGYGRAVYIRHPDDTQTVYGHLSSFAEPLRSEILAREKRSGAYTLAFNLPKPIPVERGQVLGTVGTAGTDLVHLHFELREKGTPVNPLTRGLPVPDTQAPRIDRILAVPEGPAGRVNDAHDEAEIGVPPAEVGADGVRAARLAEPVRVSGDVHLLVSVPDRIDGSERDLSPYRVTLRIDGKVWHDTVYDSSTYADMRHTELDFEPGRQFARTGLFHRLSGVGPRVRQHRVVGRSLRRLKSGDHPAQIEAADAAGNRATVDFVLRVGEPSPPCALEVKPVAAPSRKNGGQTVPPSPARVWRNNLLVLPVPDLCAAVGGGAGGAVQVEARIDGKRVKKDALAVTRLGGVPALALAVPVTVKDSVEIGWRAPQPSAAERKAGARTPAPTWHRLAPFSVSKDATVERTVDGQPVRLILDGKGLFWGYPSEVWSLPPQPFPGLEPASPRYVFGNSWVPAKGYHGVRLTRDARARNWKHVGMYLHHGGRVIRAGGAERDEVVAGNAVHLAELFLARDVADPTIGDAVVEDHPGGRRLLVPIADQGAGIGQASVSLNGKDVPLVEQQFAFGRLVWLPLVPPPPGPKTLDVSVRDRAGRTASRRFELVW